MISKYVGFLHKFEELKIPLSEKDYHTGVVLCTLASGEPNLEAQSTLLQLYERYWSNSEQIEILYCVEPLCLRIIELKCKNNETREALKIIMNASEKTRSRLMFYKAVNQLYQTFFYFCQPDQL